MLPELRLSIVRLLGVALPLALAASLLLGMGLARLLEARAQAGWQPVAARVEAAGDGLVRYRYRFGEIDYSTPPRALIYRPGDRLTVYVDPARPSHSVVIPTRLGITPLLMLALGIWFALLAAGLSCSEDPHLLLNRDGWRALLDRLSGAERRAVRRLRAVPDPRNPDSLEAALRRPLRREVRRLLGRGQGFLAPGYLADRTGMPAVLFVAVVEEIARRDRPLASAPRRGGLLGRMLPRSMA